MEDNVFTIAQDKQAELVDRFMEIINRGTLSHAYLFSGEEGAGEFEVAMTIAMRLFCQNVVNGKPCGKCNECRRIMSLDHPDVVVETPDERSIKVDQIRHIKSEFTKSAVEGNKKIFIISGAETMTTGAANSLLKFIEEPSSDITTILITTNKNIVLPTIISRTQVIDFPEATREDLVSRLRSNGVKQNSINLLLTLTNSVSEINSWLEDDWFYHAQEKVEQWFKYLVKDDRMAFTFIQTDIMPVVNNRQQQQLVLAMMVEIFRDLMELRYGATDSDKLSFPGLVKVLTTQAERISSHQVIDNMNILLDTNTSFKGNMNFQNILESTTLKLLDVMV
ncbi:DNA polymerase III subunit delta' [Lentilactobacillus sp. Marseille-Q4993]|uniref:DNA polymerase III subunit delta' n=1 Tax=Lentilactobacillus sp. Marseille-Q4993 TaxID=3039492 RepID=UPI0024BD5449|nr:DNA polymerase III subunit delta' [Lentilactobacillus sp. Marseille-Q4993]